MKALFRCQDRSRALIGIFGPDVREFLHGLYTNDVRAAFQPSPPPHPSGTDTGAEEAQLSSCEPARALYGCFLNGQGRVLFDAFVTDLTPLLPTAATMDDSSILPENIAVHVKKAVLTSSNAIGNVSSESGTKGGENELALLDIDASVAAVALEHLGAYKLRRKIRIANITATTDGSGDKGELFVSLESRPFAEEEVDVAPPAADLSLGALLTGPRTSGLLVADPRYHAIEAALAAPAPPPPSVDDQHAAEADEAPPLPFLLCRGYYHAPSLRAECTANTTAAVDTSSLFPDSTALPRALDCVAGVPVGTSVFTASKSLPFEGNTDQLGAVSFEKGCYVGQELTHRTHVMLVSRKRTVPLVLGHWSKNPFFFTFGAASAGNYSTAVAVVDDVVMLGAVDTGIPSALWGTAFAEHDRVASASADAPLITPVDTLPKARAPTSTTSLLHLATAKKKTSTEPTAAEEKEKEEASPFLDKDLHSQLRIVAEGCGEAEAVSPGGSAATAVGTVQTAQHNVAAGILRLRYVNPATRTAHLFMKISAPSTLSLTVPGATPTAPTSFEMPVGALVPVTAFIPPWWDEATITKTLVAEG